MKRQKLESDQSSDVISISKELEEEYKRQIEFYKAEEKNAKDQLREQEAKYLREKQLLESKLEDQIAINSELKLQLLSIQREVIQLKENDPVSNDTQELQHQLDQATREITLLKEAEYERDMYLAQGCFDALKLRVVHLKDNPISKLEEVPIETPRSPQDSKASSKEEVNELKKRIERMNTIFGSQTNRFRDAVYQLTGWNIEFNPVESMLRLRSRYAENREDFIELMWSGTDQFKLLDTSFIHSLDANLFTFLTVSNSFPAFLSAVTQDLFGKQTVYSSPT